MGRLEVGAAGREGKEGGGKGSPEQEGQREGGGGGEGLGKWYV